MLRDEKRVFIVSTFRFRRLLTGDNGEYVGNGNGINNIVNVKRP